jgi:two-component system, sensor histidine kinase PdtaS
MIRLYVLLLMLSATVVYGQNDISSLKNQLAAEKSDAGKLELLTELVNASYYTSLDSALEFASTGVALSEKARLVDWQPRFYEMKGRVCIFLLKVDTSEFYLNKAVAAYRKINNQKGEAATYIKLALLNKRRGELSNALKNDLAALEIMESLKDAAGICEVYMRIADDLTRQHRVKEAKDYWNKSMALCEEHNVSAMRHFLQFIAGAMCIDENNYTGALAYFNNALAIAREQHLDGVILASTTNSRGNAHKRLGHYKEALADYKITLDLSKKLNYRSGISIGLANLGETNYLLGNYRAALPYQLETVRLQERDREYVNLVENYDHVSGIYEKLGDYRSALIYQKKRFAMADNIAPIKSDAAMAEMLTRYETEKKEATIAAQGNIIAQQKTIQWLGAGAVALLVGFIVFGFISFRNSARKNELLASKNAENELLLKEIHHRVKNNLEVVSSLLALQSAQIDDANVKEAMQEGQNRVNSIGIVHQKLYQGATLGAIEMKDYFLNLSESVIDTFGAEQRVKLEVIMEKLNVDVDTAVPLGLIVNELLTNTLKYAFPNGQDGKVSISLEQQPNGILHLEVADNGSGKSGVTHGTGFGSQLVTLLTRQLNGEMREEVLNGTRVIFNFKMEKILAKG